jgi:hypothetical protein
LFISSLEVKMISLDTTRQRNISLGISSEKTDRWREREGAERSEEENGLLTSDLFVEHLVDIPTSRSPY